MGWLRVALGLYLVDWGFSFLPPLNPNPFYRPTGHHPTQPNPAAPPPARPPVRQLPQRGARPRIGHALDDPALVAGGEAAVGAEVEAQARAREGAVQQGYHLKGLVVGCDWC